MDKAAIDRSFGALRETIEDEIGVENGLTDEEAIGAMETAVSELNTLNPKNPQRYTLATAPANWSNAIEEAALRDIYAHRAAELTTSDPARARQYRSFGQNHQGLFEEVAPGLLAIRPFSSGGPRRTR